MSVFGRLLLILLFAGAVAHAQEDDDDPKAAPRHVTPAAKSSGKHADAPNAPTTSKAKPAAEASPTASKAKPASEASPSAKAKPASEAASGKSAAEASTRPKNDAKSHPAVESAKKHAAADEPSGTHKAKPAADDEGAKKALPLLPVDAEVAGGDAAAGRPVRVRLADGWTVVGQVRAEQAEALVIDCALGQLSIPRARISTIAYDAAAGVGQKHAPVQMLDDGDTLPAKTKSRNER